ncbi:MULTISPECIES: hypothetical protein [Persicobacter]|uniref:Uncharacterized protein n=1 Tax=Persicobacter diffluens TaxID=981 RepID=A0AAN4VTW0_9BACT|nr:hypothetical protein [Persicobacter sp. CCB-QB2]GJM59999.1 hypothetical protein PEDI_05510 [Persicobacter diffluens]
MHNDPELDGKYLGTITQDFAKIADNLKEASYAVRRKGFSDFPIFPISKMGMPVGQVFLKMGELDLQWNYNITFLEEFVQRGLIEKGEKEEGFKKSYKNPDEFCCLFVMDGAFTNFVFIPYPEDDKAVL